MNTSIELFFVQFTALATFLGFLVFIYPKRRASDKKMFVYDKKATLYFTIYAVFYTILFVHLFVFNSPTEYHLLGTIIALTGLLLAFVARYQLRHVWSPITKTKASKKVIASGPFAVMRHPIYVGRVLFFLGVMVMFNTWLVPLTLIYWVSLRAKVLEEEKIMAKNPAYKKYMQKTPRLF